MRVRIMVAVAMAVLAGVLWPSGWTERGLRPDFALLVVVAAGFLGRAQAGFQAGLLAGFLVAPLTLEPFGLDAALLGASGILAGQLRAYVKGDHAAVQTTVCALMSLALGVLALVRLELTSAEVHSLPLLGSVVLSAATTGLLAPPVFLLLEGLRVFGHRREGRLTLV
ncbi:MAG: rod shape-determining protein MreD [Planctomycetota bacterium]|jgi:rod shape-determining protein MreD